MKYEKYRDLYTQFLISEKNLSRNSVNNYLVDLDQFFFNEDTKVSDLNAKIKSYIVYLRKNNLKTSSINRKISVLKNFMKFLHTEKIIEQIDFQEFESLSNLKKIPKAISKLQMEQIFINLYNSKQTNKELYILVLKLIYLSGLRISEALNLKWSDINHQDNSIYIYGKGSKERKVYIIEDFLELLKKLGKKTIIINLSKDYDNLNDIIKKYKVEKNKLKLTFTYDFKTKENSPSEFLKDLAKKSIKFNEIETQKSTLEDIFLGQIQK